MGETHRKVDFLPVLGRRLIELQKKDLNKCIEHYRELEIDEDSIAGHNKDLLRRAHKIAFTIGLFVQKLSAVPPWASPYLNCLKSDTIQIISSIVLGNRRSLHLYERASIEDFLRYIYYFDHQIEHILLQNHPTKFQSIDSLIGWIKSYPSLVPYKKLAAQSCNNLTSRYGELSRTVHGTTIADIEPSDNLKASHKPLESPLTEMRILKSIFRSIIFLLSLFHLEEFRALSLDEKVLVCQHLVKKEKQVLSGVEA